MTQEKKAKVENLEEKQYLNLIKNILDLGEKRIDRTSTGTLSIFAPNQMRFNLKDNQFPLLTTKKVFLRGVFEELMWIIRGDTNSENLSSKGVKIWDQNGSVEFLKSVGLEHREKGDLGPVYGFQWRHFGAEYKDFNSTYEGQGVDQLKQLIEGIKKDPMGRRHILTAWNPKDLKLMALPPCHMFCQFYVHLKDDKPTYLSCQLYQRSADMGLGVPFNIASYSLLTKIIAKVVNLEPSEFIHVIGDAHVYLDHVEPLKVQVEREPKMFPKLIINKETDNFEDFEWSDLELVGYEPYPKIEMSMSA